MTQEVIAQGRIVWGHPGKLVQKINRTTKQKVFKDGQPVMQCSFGLAIERGVFYSQILPVMQAVVRSAFPNAQLVQPSPQFPGGLSGISPKFSWKFKDGEIDLDDKGKPYREREGYKDNCVLTISTTGFAPAIYKSNGNNGWIQIAENEIKCGDFAAVCLNIKYNGVTDSTLTPGLYINPNGVMLIGYGAEIQSNGHDPETMFAGLQPQQFAGMTQQPTMGAGPLPSGMQPNPAGYAGAAPGMPPAMMPNAGTAAAGPMAVPTQPQYAPAQPAQPTTAYPSAPAQLPPPAHDFVQNAMGQPPVAQPGYPAPLTTGPAGYPAAPAQPMAYAPQPGYIPGAAPAMPAAPAAPGMYPGNPVGR